MTRTPHQRGPPPPPPVVPPPLDGGTLAPTHNQSRFFNTPMNFNSTRGLAVALAALLAISLVGGAFVGTAAAEDAMDPEITTDSDLDEGDVILEEDFDPTESPTDEGDYEEVIEVEADNEELELVVETTAGETEHVMLDHEDDAFEVVTEATDTDPGTYTFDLAHEELADVPMQINEQVSLDVTVTDTASEADETPETTFTFDVENGEERSVMYVSEDVDSDFQSFDVEADALETGGNFLTSATFGAFGEETESFDVFEVEDDRDLATWTDAEEDTHVTDIETHFADDEADAFDAALDDDAESGDVIPGMALTHDGEFAMVFYEEADEDFVDTDVDTYAVYDGEVLDLYTGEDYEDEEEVTVFAANNDIVSVTDLDADELATLGDAMTLNELRSEFGILSGFGIWNAAGGFGILGFATLATGLAVSTRRPTGA